MSAPVRIALVGNGFARTVMLPALRNVRGCEVVGICSPSHVRRKETAREFGIPYDSGDLSELLADIGPDALFIASPPDVHEAAAVAGLEAGCHVLCEKPTALNASESRRMLDSARAHPEQLALIDHELRFDPRRMQMREWAEAGEFGELRHASYTIHSPSFRGPRPWSWWSDRARGGGALGALGSHAIDALRSILGEVEAVRGQLHTFSRERIDPESGRPRAVTSDDFFTAWLRFESGALATIEVSLVEALRHHRFSIAGTAGAAEVIEQGALRASLAENFESGQPMTEVTWSDDLASNADLGIPDTDWARSFVRYSGRVIDAIREARGPEGAATPLVRGAATFEDGHLNQRVLDAIRSSSETGAWIPCADSGSN